MQEAWVSSFWGLHFGKFRMVLDKFINFLLASPPKLVYSVARYKLFVE